MAATAVRVFGKPITQGTHAQRAQEAKNNQNVDDQVLQSWIQSQKAAIVAVGGVNMTFGMIYNATGGPLTFRTTHEWEGKFKVRPANVIQNGQWAVFWHVSSENRDVIGTHGKVPQGSVAAVVYNIKDNNCCDSMIAWNNPWKLTDNTWKITANSAYCEMKEPGYYDESCNWDKVYAKLKASGNESEARMKGYSTKVWIDAEGNTPIFTALFYLDF